MTDLDFTARATVAGSERMVPAAAVDTGPADPSERTSVTIVVRPRASSLSAAERLANAAPAERSYVTRSEFAAAYGADPADVLAVERFALAVGLIVLEADLARRSVIVEGTLGSLAAAFEAELKLFKPSSGDVFRGRVGTLTVPAALGGVISGVFGLDDRPQASAKFRRLADLAVPAASATAFPPPSVAAAYGFPAGSQDGTGQTIALVELGGGFAQSDLDTFFTNLGIPVPSVTSVAVDGAANAPVGTQSSADSEVLLDIEVAGAIAPGAKIVVYFAPNTDQGFLDAITTAIHDKSNNPTILSISWGGPESSWTAQAMQNFDAAFADAATLGVTVTAAAGDHGSSDGVADGANHVDFPASSPHVLACGGTSLQASGATIQSETVWNDGAGGGATGGGVSSIFDLPAYQQSAGVPVINNAAGKPGRGVPDVSGDADPQTGYAIYVDGSAEVVGGTSAVAPLWAALVARLNQRAGKPLGFINPTLYANATALNDIVTGNNGAFSAMPGWDACTGLGSPNGPKLLALFPAAAAPALPPAASAP